MRKVTYDASTNAEAVVQVPEDDLAIQELIVRLGAHRWWIIASIGLFAAAFTAVAFTMTPVYRAAAILAPASPDRDSAVMGFAASSLGGLASGLGIGPKDSQTEEALAVLRSREFTERFLNESQLMPKLFPREWDSATRSWKARVKNPPTLSKGYKYFDREVRSVIPDRKTGLVSIQVDWTDRNDAADWANELVRRLNEEMRARAIARADASTNFLESELSATSSVEARDAIARLMEAQVKERMIAHVTHDYSFRVVGKAMVSDKDDPIRPDKRLMALAGAILGLFVGVIVALILESRRARSR